MPRGFSDSFMRPKKDGKGDPRLKYKIGDFLGGIKTIFDRGVQTGYVNLSYSHNSAAKAWGIGTNLIFATLQTASSILFGCNKNGYTVSSTQAQINATIDTGTPYVAVDQNDNIYVQTQNTGTTGGTKKYPGFSATPTASDNNMVGTSIVCDKVDSLYYRVQATNNVARINYSLANQWTKTDLLDAASIDWWRPVSDGLLVLTSATNMVLRKYSKTSGALLWSCTIITGTANGEIQVDGSGNIYVGLSTGRIAKVSSEGELLWVQNAGAVANFPGRGLAVSDRTGMIYCTTSSSPFMAVVDATTGIVQTLTSGLAADQQADYSGLSNDGGMKCINEMLYYFGSSTFITAKVVGIEIKA